MNKKLLIIFFCFGLLLRITLIPLPGVKNDVETWFYWANRLTEAKFSSFYSEDYLSDYTPGYLYILYMLGSTNKFFALDPQIFYYILKLPAIFAEVILSLFVYKILKKQISEKLSIIGACLILFNPALIFNSSVWGQVDSILALLMLLAVKTLSEKRMILSFVLYSLSFIFKLQAISILPVFLLYIMKEKKYFNLIIKFLFVLLFITFLLSYPFFPYNTLTHLINLALKTGNEYPYTSLSAFNFWGIIGFWIPDKINFGILSYQNWGFTAFSLNWIVLGYLFLKQKISVYNLATLATLSFYFLPTRIHERYLYPTLPFLIISAFYLKSKILTFLSLLMSILHFLNLYFVYIYYNYFYFHLPTAIYSKSVYVLLSQYSNELSIISVTFFMLIYLLIIKHESTRKN